MKRRRFLAAAATTPAGLWFGEAAQPLQQEVPGDIARALAEFRKSIPSHFDREYVEHAVIPFFLSSVFEAERPALPMIDVTLSKQDALPWDLWGLIYKQWRPMPEEGVTVFLQGLEKRGDHNLRKRIYQSALTPDLYDAMYHDKVVAFFDHLFEPQFAGKPFMRHYLDYYFDLYWDLHVGVQGAAIPADVRQIGESFNTVLAYRNPREPIVYEHYMKVRAKLGFLTTRRRLGELLKRMKESGERRGPGDPDTSRGATSLAGLGIPRDRASRAMQLATITARISVVFMGCLMRRVSRRQRRLVADRRQFLAGRELTECRHQVVDRVL